MFHQSAPDVQQHIKGEVGEQDCDGDAEQSRWSIAACQTAGARVADGDAFEAEAEAGDKAGDEADAG